MSRMPIRHRIAPLIAKPCSFTILCGIRPDFSGLSPCDGQVAYALLTRAPVAGGSKQAYFPAAPRLACVKPVASVHPEPGSNSPLLVCLFVFFLLLSRDRAVRQAPGRIMCCYRIDRAVMLMTLLLYYFLSIVIISMFLFACPSGKSVAKLQPLFHSRKLFGEKIC